MKLNNKINHVFGLNKRKKSIAYIAVVLEVNWNVQEVIQSFVVNVNYTQEFDLIVPIWDVPDHYGVAEVFATNYSFKIEGIVRGRITLLAGQPLFLGEGENGSSDIEFPLYLLRVEGIGHVLQNHFYLLFLDHHLIVYLYNVGFNRKSSKILKFFRVFHHNFCDIVFCKYIGIFE